jgi:DNA polymerase (family 10)
MDKHQVAEILTQIGTLLELKGENPFKTRAYFNGARIIDTLSESLEKLVAENRLGTIPGIGEALQKKISELVTTGRLGYYEDLKASLPAGLMDMMQVPGVGPKKIKVLYDQLQIDSVEKLEAACQDGRVAALKGFGAKTALNICEGIARRRSYASKHLLSDALLVAEPILEDLRSHPDVIRCSTAGSLRRCREIIGDIDFLVSSKNPPGVIDYFTHLPGLISVLGQGETKASVVLAGGIQADLRVVSDAEFPFALAYFTGSKEHNIVMRQRAIERGLRLNEYGLFRSQEETRDPKLGVRCRTEEDLFQELGLHYIPPELREDCGEFAFAEREPWPRLIEWSDIKGSLHNHSNWSDGLMTLDEIVRAMIEMGLSYWAITDHSKSSVQANGLDAAKLRRQIREVRAVNERLASEGIDFRLLTGTEVDILSEGRLDFPDDVLAELDVVVASAHQRLAIDEAENTKRIIRAAENRYVHMLGHLTGRLLLEREPQKVNVQAVIDACAETGTWIELNASPDRLDMDWRHWSYARNRGVKCVINCDGHRFEHVGYLRLGAQVARKGGLTRQDVINTLTLAKLQAALKVKRNR